MIYKNYSYFCVVDNKWQDEELISTAVVPTVCSCHSQNYKLDSLYVKNVYCKMYKIKNAVMQTSAIDKNNITLHELTDYVWCINHCLEQRKLIELLDGEIVKNNLKVVNNTVQDYDKRIIINKNVIKKIITKIKNYDVRLTDQNNLINLMRMTIDKLENKINVLTKSNLDSSIDTNFF